VNSLADGLGVAKDDAAAWLAAASIDATIRPALVTTAQALDLYAAWKPPPCSHPDPVESDSGRNRWRA
jgi:hypothetical protein